MKEGWLGDDYFVLFSGDEALSASRRYGIDQALPGYTIIGLRNWDDFVVRDAAGRTYTVPAVPLVPDYRQPADVPDGALLQADDRLAGRIRWYVTPLVFGGDPAADENLTWVSHEQHAGLVVWWNAKHREMTAK